MTIAPGKNIACTVTKEPLSEADAKTIARLMRRDPSAKRKLARAQRLRRQRMNVFNRGNRDWISREKPAAVVAVRTGATWSMTYTPDIAGDLAKVARWVKVDAKG
ncbi:MAG: hypothetical protein FJ255_06730 [Phycisphaerae bacterium]|nr:hypothetical protein [Phycisphaerae bacterium]